MRRLLRSRVYRWPHRSQPSGFVEQHECSKRNRLAQLMIAAKGRQDRESEVFRHSDLNSVTGSIRAARSAGKYPASAAMAARIAIVPPNVKGSVAVTPYKSEVASRVVSSAPISPIAAPIPAKRIVSAKISCLTAVGNAPNAILIPISVWR